MRASLFLAQSIILSLRLTDAKIKQGFHRNKQQQQLFQQLPIQEKNVKLNDNNNNSNDRMVKQLHNFVPNFEPTTNEILPLPPPPPPPAKEKPMKSINASIPTNMPTVTDTDRPTKAKTDRPTKAETDRPTKAETDRPISSLSLGRPPTAHPSLPETDRPTAEMDRRPISWLSLRQPTAHPSAAETDRPIINLKEITSRPTLSPTADPTVAPTAGPTVAPTVAPTANPTAGPTEAPTANPTTNPTFDPTNVPSMKPSKKPTASPTAKPSTHPTSAPTIMSSNKPSITESRKPSGLPSSLPTFSPSFIGSHVPSITTSALPSAQASNSPTAFPTTMPTSSPSFIGSQLPSITKTTLPSAQPSLHPTNLSSSNPSINPTVNDLYPRKRLCPKNNKDNNNKGKDQKQLPETLIPKEITFQYALFVKESKTPIFMDDVTKVLPLIEQLVTERLSSSCRGGTFSIDDDGTRRKMLRRTTALGDDKQQHRNHKDNNNSRRRKLQNEVFAIDSSPVDRISTETCESNGITSPSRNSNNAEQQAKKLCFLINGGITVLTSGNDISEGTIKAALEAIKSGMNDYSIIQQLEESTLFSSQEDGVKIADLVYLGTDEDDNDGKEEQTSRLPADNTNIDDGTATITVVSTVNGVMTDSSGAATNQQNEIKGVSIYAIIAIATTVAVLIVAIIGFAVCKKKKKRRSSNKKEVYEEHFNKELYDHYDDTNTVLDREQIRSDSWKDEGNGGGISFQRDYNNDDDNNTNVDVRSRMSSSTGAAVMSTHSQPERMVHDPTVNNNVMRYSEDDISVKSGHTEGFEVVQKNPTTTLPQATVELVHQPNNRSITNHHPTNVLNGFAAASTKRVMTPNRTSTYKANDTVLL